MIGLFGLSGAHAVLLLGWNVGGFGVAAATTLTLAGIVGCKQYSWCPWSDCPLSVLNVCVFFALPTAVFLGLLGYTVWISIALAVATGNWILLILSVALLGLLVAFLFAIGLIACGARPSGSLTGDG